MTATKSESWADRWDDVRRSFSDFVAVPAGIVTGFVLLAIGTYMLDRHSVAALEPLHDFLKQRLITDRDTTSTLLSTIAGAIITVTSITFSLLLLAVQQSASAFTAQVLDQFLERRLNQAYFGVFVGVSVYTLIILATNDSRVTPVFGAATGLLLTVLALIVLILLLYSTLNQMRPERIIAAIHDLTLTAREGQHTLLARTRREPRLSAAPASVPVHASNNGYIADLDLDRIGKATAAAAATSEVVMLASIGDNVSYGQRIAVVSAADESRARSICDAVESAVRIERQRSFKNDPGFGLAQLSAIGWTSISSSKSNPLPGLVTIHSLRDLLARWIADEPSERDSPDANKPAVPVVYRDDVPAEAVDVLESLMIVSSESMQHQSAAEVLNAFTGLFPRMPRHLRDRVEDSVLRCLSSLGDHVPARDLTESLRQVSDALRSAGRNQGAERVDEALRAFTSNIGTFASRGTRGEGGGSASSR